MQSGDVRPSGLTTSARDRFSAHDRVPGFRTEASHRPPPHRVSYAAKTQDSNTGEVNLDSMLQILTINMLRNMQKL